MKERKGSVSQLAIHELENDSMDEEGPSAEIVEEDDSPTASSTSLGSLGGCEPNLAESLEIEICEQAGQEVMGRDEEVIAGQDVCTKEPTVLQMQKELIDPQASHKDLGPDDKQECRDEVDQTALHVCCMDGLLCSKATMEEGTTQQLEQARAPFDGKVLGISEDSQGLVQMESGENGLVCLTVEQQKLSMEFKRQELEPKVGRAIKDHASAEEYPQSSVSNRTGRDSRSIESKYFEGSQSMSFQPFRKPTSSAGSVYSANSGSAASFWFGAPTPRPYRSKPVMNRSVPLCGSPHVAWTRKTQQPAAVDSATESLDDESEKSDVAASMLQKTMELFPEQSHALDEDLLLITSKAPKEESRNLEKREAMPAVLPATFGGIVSSMSSMPSNRFHLDTNSEDWPCLPHRPGASTACDPKPTSVLVLAANSIEPEAGSVPCSEELLKLEEGQVERCSVSPDVLVGSLSVPLGKFAAQPSVTSRAGVGRSCSSPSLSWAQVGSPSYTAVLAAPAALKHTQEMDGGNTHHLYDMGSGSLDIAGTALDEHSKEFFAGSSHCYRGASPRHHFPLMSLAPKHLKYHAGPAVERREQGGLLKQGSWLSGTGRFLAAAKVWRPIRSSGGEHTEDSSLRGSTVNENVTAGTTNSPTAGSVRMQLVVAKDRNASSVLKGRKEEDFEAGEEESCCLEACSSSSSSSSNERRVEHSNEKTEPDQQGLLYASSGDHHKVAETESTLHEEGCPEDCEAGVEHFHSEQADGCAPYHSDDEADVNSPDKGPASVENKCEDAAIVKLTVSHSAWIAEALDCHYMSKLLCSSVAFVDLVSVMSFSLKSNGILLLESDHVLSACLFSKWVVCLSWVQRFY